MTSKLNEFLIDLQSDIQSILDHNLYEDYGSWVQDRDAWEIKLDNLKDVLDAEEQKTITQQEKLEIVNRHMNAANEQAFGIPLTLALNKYAFAILYAIDEVLERLGIETINEEPE